MGQCVLYMQIFAFSLCRVERLLLNLFMVCIRFVRIMRINQPSLLRTPKTQMFSWMTSLTKSKVFGVWSVLKKRWTPIQCKFSITSPPFNPINHDICCCRKIARLWYSFAIDHRILSQPAIHPLSTMLLLTFSTGSFGWIEGKWMETDEGGWPTDQGGEGGSRGQS